MENFDSLIKEAEEKARLAAEPAAPEPAAPEPAASSTPATSE